MAAAKELASPAVQRRWMLIAGYASVSVALLLIVAKLLAWVLTGSASMLASLTDSLMDSLASFVNLFAIRLALQPPDANHRFGHGKAESIAAVAQAAFMGGSGVLLVLYCAEGLWRASAHTLTNTGAGVAVSIFALVATVALLAVQSYAVKVSASDTVRADRLHYRSDLLINGSVLLALLGSAYGLEQLDLLFGFGIAAYIIISATRVGNVALHSLMDRELPASIDTEIRDVAMSQEGVEGLHDLRTRRSGRDYLIQMHLEIDDNTRLIDAHAIAESVEQGILERFPNADVIIHQDPASIGASEHDQLAEEVHPEKAPD